MAGNVIGGATAPRSRTPTRMGRSMSSRPASLRPPSTSVSTCLAGKLAGGAPGGEGAPPIRV